MTMKKLLSAGLIAVLCFASTATAFAGTSEPQLKAESAKAQPIAATQEQALDFKMPSLKQSASTKAVSGSIKVVNIKSNLSELKDADITTVAFDQDEILRDYSSSQYLVGYSQQVKLSGKGVLQVVLANSASSGKNVTFGLYEDAKLTKKVDYEGYANKDDTAQIKYIKVPKAGTYYLGIHCTQGKSYGQPFINAVAVSAAFVSGADRTVTSGKAVAIGAKDKQSTYLKFKATSTGYISVSAKSVGYFYGSAALYSSSKKALSKDTNLKYLPTYGVTKGSTYYVKVTGGSSTEGIYYITTSNKSISESSGSSKSKAKTLSAKKTKYGTIAAGSSTSDWYKVSLSSSRNISILMKGRTNDQLRIAVYNSKNKLVSTGSSRFYYTTGSLTLKSTAKMSKGTYYIKVYRGNSYSSGWYSLYWK